MKALVFKGIGNVQIEEKDDPILENPSDAIIKIQATSICGTDLHMVRGTMAGMKKGTTLGHEAVGIVEQIGSDVSHIKVGDRVVVTSTIACGQCVYCEAQEFSSCDYSNPKGTEAGTAFFGGPELTGPFDGLQAEKALIPFADTNLIKIPESVSDEDALLISDVFPTGYMGAEMADVQEGDIIAVFGCGPVGQFAIASAFLLGAKTVIAIDAIEDRLAMAQAQGAISVNYEKVDPIAELKRLSNGFGPDGCIDAVGVDAQGPHQGPAEGKFLELVQNMIEQKIVAPFTIPFGNQWRAGDAPFRALTWCIESCRKSGVVSIVGVYPQTALFLPIGLAMGKALTIRAANCSHAKYIPKLLKLVEDGIIRPSQIISKQEPFGDIVECYKQFDQRKPGWLKVELFPNSIG